MVKVNEDPLRKRPVLLGMVMFGTVTPPTPRSVVTATPGGIPEVDD